MDLRVGLSDATRPARWLCERRRGTVEARRSYHYHGSYHVATDNMNKGSLLAFGHLQSQGLATMLHAAATSPHPLNRPNMPLPALSADAGAARNGENLLGVP